MAALSRGERWDLVFNIAEGMYGIGREAQVPALLDAHRIPYVFSDTVVLAVSLHKALTKRIMRDAGLPTPPFALVSTKEEIAAVDLLFPLFAKPVAEGTSKGIDARSRVETAAQLKETCTDLLERFNQPVLVETYLPGREITVGIVGTGKDARPLTILEVLPKPGVDAAAYSYENKENCEELIDYVLVDDAQLTAKVFAAALGAWRVMECRDGGRVDLRADADGEFQIMEINPLPGLHPEHSDLPIMCNLAGIPYLDLMDMIMRSAVQRAGLEVPPRREG
jgi:D-alanine-D-alanine ligase